MTAYYIVFLTHPPNREHAENPMPSPVDSVMMMFLMSLYNFGGTYEAFARTEHETVAKVITDIFEFECHEWLIYVKLYYYQLDSIRHLHGNCRNSTH